MLDKVNWMFQTLNMNPHQQQSCYSDSYFKSLKKMRVDLIISQSMRGFKGRIARILTVLENCKM